MDFALTDEQRELKDRAAKFAREVIRPAAPEHDRDESTPWEVIKEARRRGSSGLDHYAAHGQRPHWPFGVIYRRGAPLGLRRNRPGDLRAPGSPRRGSLLRAPPSRSPSWVPQCFGTDDEIRLGAYAVTEPQAGSDVKSLRTTARREATSGS